MPVILMTAYGSLKTAVDGIKAGAFDYLSKPFIIDEVRLVARRALEHKYLSRQNQVLRDQLKSRYRFDNLVGSSPAMVAVYKSIARVAQTESTVLLQGESGTGKELIARAIHANSARSAGPFVTVDGGALAETLLESELFGHERGSFTGAIAMKKGLLEKAHLGTCFLDEVADLSPALQGKLLRVIQEREIRRVGSTSSMTIDVRIIAASKKNLESLVKAGTFREDLFYRLNVVSIDIPPLRERPEDIPLLVQFFIQSYGATKDKAVTGLSPEAMELLIRYWWPGNVRELEHAVERAVALTPHSIICPEDLPGAIKTATVQTVAQAQGWVTLTDLEKDHILRVLESHDRDLGRSALILGIHRKTLLRKLRQYGVASQFGVG
jgi:DNA-binding NtrC family response regulator